MSFRAQQVNVPGRRNKNTVKNSLITHSSHVLSSVQPAHPSHSGRRCERTLSTASQSIWTADRRSGMLLGDRRCHIASILSKILLWGSQRRRPEVGEETRRRQVSRFALKLFHVTFSLFAPWCFSQGLWHVNYGQNQTNAASYYTKQYLPNTHTHTSFFRRGIEISGNEKQ